MKSPISESVSSKLRALQIVHNHPSIRPGGAEIHARQLFLALQQAGDVDSYLLARSGPPQSNQVPYREGTLTAAVNASDREFFFYTGENYDYFIGTTSWKEQLTTYFAAFLRDLSPNVVHFHHTLYLGYDSIRMARLTLPTAAIIFTLHDYGPICHRDGQLLRTNNRERCLTSDSRKCNECFPNFSPQDFFLRQLFIKSNFKYVDRFIAPSSFARDRYIQWGLEAQRITVEECGSPNVKVPAKRPQDFRRFGFFGQISAYKGVNVLLEAFELLAFDQVDANLMIFGANLDLAAPSFQSRVTELLERNRRRVIFCDTYSHETVMEHMGMVDWVVVPSVWWENSPLVIQEAFSAGRPIICSGIGALAEKIRNGIDGLHVEPSSPRALADVIKHCSGNSELWNRLSSAITPRYMMTESASRMTGIYHDVLATKL